MTMQRLTMGTAAMAAVLAVNSAPVGQSPAGYACRIDPSGNTSGPSADICDQIVRRWRLLTGAAPTPGEIHLITRGALNTHGAGGYWTLEWPAPASTSRAAPKRKRDGLPAHLAENILPHEAGHHVLATYLGLSSAASDGYGSPAPDWIDEAAAVWMESRAAREQRVRGVAGTQPSLTKIALMGHPARTQMQQDLLDANARNVERTVTPPCPRCASLPERMRTKYQIITTTFGADGTRKTVVSYADVDPNSDETVEQRGFYPFAYSLLRFIRVRGGVTAVLELMGRYRVNPAPRVDVLLGLPGLPNSVNAFEAAWREFLHNPPPEDP
jgi:hypothetical protein